MKFLKQKRIIDPILLEQVRKKPCLACGKRGPSDPHHLKTVKSGGDDVIENLAPFCRPHHVEIHKIGLFTFSQKYDCVNDFLTLNGWRVDGIKRKWVRF